MASSVNAPRGMRDFLPAEKAQRDRVLHLIRSTYRAHGFDEIETPALEDGDRLHSGLGGDNEKLAFAVMRRGLTVDDLTTATEPLDLADLGLRFDLTVPLARFYASHRAELPTVFRAIQIAPVWRAERPQKGRYRQFVQCDIDIIGESGIGAEVELITATAATLDALGLAGCSIRINDRRLLTSALTIFGFPAQEHDAVLVSLDKLDKLGQDGVLEELRERAFPAGPVAALEAFFRRPGTPGTRETPGTSGTREMPGTPGTPGVPGTPGTPGTPAGYPFDERAIRAALPAGVDPVAVAELAAIGLAVEAGRAAGRGLGGGDTAEATREHGGTGLAEADREHGGTGPAEATREHPPIVQFDPWLVRGMGYYTGAIFEVSHPNLGYSLGGGGRYDGMIGRFLGGDVPAVGFSLGFERLVDLVVLPTADVADAVALVHDADVPPATLVAMQAALIARGRRVRLERKPRNLAPLLAQLAASGFTEYAYVSVGNDLAELEFRAVERD